jgi:hypothetical protein
MVRIKSESKRKKIIFLMLFFIVLSRQQLGGIQENYEFKKRLAFDITTSIF